MISHTSSTRQRYGMHGSVLQWLLVLLTFMLYWHNAQAATNFSTEYTTATSLPNNTCTSYTSITIPVTDSYSITDLNVGLNITHPNRADIDAKLTSPAGTTIFLFTDIGGTGDHLDILLDDSATTDIGTLSNTPNHTVASPYYKNLFNPEGAIYLSAFNGQNSKGNWVLGICDDSTTDATIGTVNRIKLDFSGILIDYGDAPDATAGTASGNYQTKSTDNGASHLIVPQLMLGTSVDTDSGTLQNSAATADDTNGTDDEDALKAFPQIMTTAGGQPYVVTARVTNQTYAAAYLTGYIDFNRDGDFLDAGEKSDTQYVSWDGYVRLTFTLPTTITTGTVYARLRLGLTESETQTPTGAATSGEVEDYTISIVAGTYYDYSDAPSTYGDAKHVINNNIYLGANKPDAEAASQASFNAFDDGYDEDGAPHANATDTITLFPLLKKTASSYSVDIITTNNTTSAAKLTGWIDFDKSGTFDADEAAQATVAIGTTQGTTTLTWNSIPSDIKVATSFIRLRLTTDSAVTTSTPSTTASNGEVEDFPIAIAQAIPADSSSVTILRNDTAAACSSVVWGDDFNDLIVEQYFGANTAATPATIRNWTTTGGGNDTYARTTSTTTNAAQGTSIYFGNGVVRRIYPDIGTKFTFDGNGKLLTPIEAIELRDDADDVTPSVHSSQSDWGPDPVTFSRTFATTAGQKYRLYFSAIPEDPNSSYWKSGIMRVDTPSGSIHFKAPGGAEGIQKYRIEFTATAATSTISFVNYGHVNTNSSGWCDPNSPLSAWCTVGGSVTDVNANELVIDDVSVALASNCTTSKITGTVYSDNNVNDSFDSATESGLSNITLALYDNKNTTATTTDDELIATTTTAADGSYQFADVSSALHYRIEVDTQDTDLPASAYLGTSNPLADVIPTAGATLANQNFGFDVACSTARNEGGGAVFRDFNQNGIKDSTDMGIASITVNAYDNSNTLVATATTDANGWYKFSSYTNGAQYRLEFVGLPSNLYSGAHGTDNTSNVRFITAAPNCGIHYAVSDPIEYCQVTPYIAAPLYTNGTSSGAANYASIYTFPYTASGASYEQMPVPVTKATVEQTGALWGMAYQRSSKTLFSSAVMRRFVGFGALGTGGIYKTDMSDPNATTGASNYIDVRTLGIPTGDDVRSTTDSCNALAPDPAAPAHDVAAWDAVGKIGIGDIDYDETNNTLWLVNLNDRKLYGLKNISPTTTPTAANVVGGYAINLPSPYSCTSGTFRPWAVKAYRGALYVGGVCDAASDPYTISNLRGFVLKIDPANTAAGFSYVKDFPINQNRASFGITYGDWSGWIPQTDAIGWPYFHTPIVSNLEFDNDGSIMVGIMDRAGMQNGNNLDEPDCSDSSIDYTDARGDILRLCKTATGFANDTDPSCTTSIPSNVKIHDEYYWGDYGPYSTAWESMNEISLGGLAFAPGQSNVLTNAVDASNWWSNGVMWFNNKTGAREHTFHVASPTTGKSAGMGELEILCDQSPLEVGNRVWNDTDKDGIQDANESGIGNTSVTLTCGTDTATTTTDSLGEYYFSNKTGGNATFMGNNEACTLSINGNQTSISAYSLTTQNADSKTDNNAQTDIRDSDASNNAGTAEISFTTGTSGQNNHSLDFGYKAGGVMITGKVFEDMNYGGGTGRAFGSSGTAGMAGATVELYNASGTFISNTSTASDGGYSFSGLSAANYFVRVVNDSLKSTRSGSNGTERGIQTYRTDGTTAVINEVGGRKPASIDASANTTNQTLNTATFVLSGGGQAQSVQPITVASSSISGANFGFNFSTVINTNDSGQGSFRQAILNANLLSNAGLAQPDSTYGVDSSVVKEVIVFNIPATGDTLGRADICGGTSCKITVNTQLPAISAPTIIDGTTQPNYVVGTPGVPKIHLSPVSGLDAIGLKLAYNAPDSTVRGLAMTGFKTSTMNRAINVEGERVIVESNYIGLKPDGTADANGYGILLEYTQSAVIGGATAAKRNIISGNKHFGIGYDTGASGGTIQNNFIGTNPAGTAAVANGGGIDLESANNTKVLDNVIAGNTGDGIQLGFTSASSITTTGYTIQGNRIGVGINGEALGNNAPGIMLYGGTKNSLIGGTTVGQANVIAYNLTGGIRIAPNSNTNTQITISGNSIYANGNLGIDLTNDGVTVNDANDADTGANDLLNFPLISSATISGSNIVLQGCAPAGATVELFEADVSAGGKANVGDNKQGKTKDYGEGQTYLLSFVEGSGSDTDSSACALATDADGNNTTGMKAFSVTIAKPSSVTYGDILTATASLTASGTSEFSPTVNIAAPTGISGTVFEDVNYGGGAGRTISASGTTGITAATVELYNASGTFVTSTTTASDGSYTLSGVANGNYFVRVVNDTVKSTRSGSNGTERGVQTFRTDGVTAVTNEVGGRHPSVADSSTNSTNQTLNTTTFVLSGGGQAQSVQPITISGSSASGVSFGFNFDTIVNTNDSGQGSLRQFLSNANLLGNSGLTQALPSAISSSYATGDEVAIFMIPSNALSAGVAVINLNSALPSLTASNTALDGRTQTQNIGNTNNVNLTSATSVGVDNVAIAAIAAPEIALVGQTWMNGLDVRTDNTRVYDIGLRRFDTAIRFDQSSTGAVISGVAFGVNPVSGGDPSSGERSNQHIAVNAANVQFTLRNSLLGYTQNLRGVVTGQNNAVTGLNILIEANQFVGIGQSGGTDNGAIEFLRTNTSTLKVIGNKFVGRGKGIASDLAVEFNEYSSGAITCPTCRVENNDISGFHDGIGYFTASAINGLTISKNRVTDNTEFAVFLGNAQNTTVTLNQLYNNGKSGVLVNQTGAQVAITQNSIYNNGEVGINLAGGNEHSPGGATLNDANDADTGANTLLNFPILTQITTNAGDLTISGCAPAGATLELFEADTTAGGAVVGANRFGLAQDYGEGQTYLASFVEGGASDTDTGTCALTTDTDGNDATGMKAFSVTFSTPASFTTGDALTATATVSGVGTSEFSPTISLLQTSAISGRVFEDVNYGGNAGRDFGALGTVGINGARVELYNTSGALITATTTAGSGSNQGIYSFANISVGNYYVRVVSDTVSSSRSGTTGAELGVMTFRTDGTTPVTNEIGGRNKTSSDAESNTGTATLNTSTFAFSGGALAGKIAQVVQPVTLSATSLSNVSIGFNFDTVVNANDSGQGSLRQVLLNANLLGDDSSLAQTGLTSGKENAILMLPTNDPNYNATSNYWSIALQSSLPTLNAPLVLDSSLQSGFTGNPVIELKGTNAGASANGLTLGAGSDGSVIRELAINRFSGAGIAISNSQNHTLQGNNIGTDNTGTVARGNTGAGIKLDTASNCLIGSDTSSKANIIANNGGDGISIIGATSLANSILGNSIYANGGLGIDLNDDAVTANDAGDGDSGANDLLNYPVAKVNSFGANGSKIITYDFDLDVPVSDYRVEFFVSDVQDSSGNGEGQTFIGYKDLSVAATGSINYKGAFNATQAVNQGALISATLTAKTGGGFGATSEFSGIKAGISTSVCNDLTIGIAADMVIDENASVITLLEAKDSSGNPITYVISGGADKSLFTLTAPTAGATLDCTTVKFADNSVVITKSAALDNNNAPDSSTRAGSVPLGDYEVPQDAGKDNVYDLQITATVKGQQYVQDLHLRVMNVNEVPIITSVTAVNLVEDSVTKVLDINAQDPDAGTSEGNGLSYSISGGADASNFTVDTSSGVLNFHAIPDYDAPADADKNNVYAVSITVTDNGGLTASKTFSVTVTNNTADDGVKVQTRAMLQGAYDTATQSMSADLASLGYLPDAQPYGSKPFSYSGTETMSGMVKANTGQNANVDWVLVDLRSSSSTIVATRAAMLQSDGDVVDAQTGSTTLHFASIPAGNYYVSLRHRNHLGVLTASPLALSNTETLVDFSLAATAVKGEQARYLANNLAMLWAGDINGNHTLTANGPSNDVTALLSTVISGSGNNAANTNYILHGYAATDLNMDGKTLFTGPANDASVLMGNIILHPNNTGFAANYIVKGGFAQ